MRDGDVLIDDFRPVLVDGCRAEVIPYRLQSRTGYMLRLDDQEQVPLSLDSPATGWHEIHVGFMGPSSIRVRIAGDPSCRWLDSSVQWDAAPGQGEDAFWRIADLTGARFEFRSQVLARRYDQRRSQIAYLRLVPISAKVARDRLARQGTRTTRTAGAVIDGHEMLGAYCPQTPDEVRGLVAPFVDSDFRRIHFGCTCTTMRMTYLSRVGYYLGQGHAADELHSDANRRCALSLARAEEQGYDPVDVLIEYCRDQGLELWTDFRIQQDYPLDYPGGVGLDFNSPVAAAHPQWRHVDRQGQVCSHLFSHFHAGWEQHKLDLLAELAAKGPAGIHLNLMCEMGAIWDFALDAVARFVEEYGVDPTATPEPPEEWYRFRCDHLTGFMRRLRQQTDGIAAGLGRRIRIAVQVSGDWAVLKHGQLVRAVSQNHLAGFDVGRWAREGLVDVVSPSFRRTYKPMFLEHLWEELGPARSQVEVIPSIGQHDNAVLPRGYEWSLYFTDAGAGRQDLVPFGELDAWRVLREAHDLYRQGADAVDVWEMGHAPVRLSRWNVLRHIGDRQRLAQEFGNRVSGLLGSPERPVAFVAGE